MPGYDRRLERDFARCIRAHRSWSVVISEGDSWFSYPFARNVVDWLDDPQDTGVPAKQTKWSLLRLEGSGDEILAMLSGGQRADLRDRLDRYDVQVLLFSGGGNDIVGPDLLPLLVPFVNGMTAADCLVRPRLDRRLRQIRDAYCELLDLVADSGKPTVVVSHGYDYPKPSRVGVKLLGGAIKLGPWLLPYLEERGIRDKALQAGIVKILIDEFDAMLQSLAGPSFVPLDVRGLVGDDWVNEIHANRRGSRRVAARFAAELVRRFPGLAFPGLLT